MKAFRIATAVVALAATLGLGPASLFARAPADHGSPDVKLAALQAASPGLRFSLHPRTSHVTFLAAERAHSLQVKVAGQAPSSAEAAARAFLTEYGTLFGLADAQASLRVKRITEPLEGVTAVRLQQQHNGVPVIGGELIVHTLADRSISAVIGQIAPFVETETTPTVSAEAATALALADTAAREGVSAESLAVEATELSIYNPTLLKPAMNVNQLAWRVEVRSTKLDPVGRMVVVGARRPGVLVSISRIADAKVRRVYDLNNTTGALPGTLIRVEGGGASAITDVNLAYDYTGLTYDFYFNVHGRDSIDGAGMPLTSTTRYCTPTSACPYANAFWNGNQMVFGAGYASADDVVAHELTHGVTDRESELFYYYQSGAINEALSDAWGEFVDLVDGRGTDTAGVRWQMGEDLSIGAIRNMSDPTLFGDPDKMTSANYSCDLTEADSGGVHTNSGVLNKAVALMVDGGTFNGKTVTALGITTTARILYVVQTGYLSSASDFLSMYNATNSACLQMMGQYGITSATCASVKNALDAVEMSTQNASCTAPEASVCSANQIPRTVFYDDLENTGSGKWVEQVLTGKDAIYYPETADPYGLYDPYATSGRVSVWLDDLETKNDAAFAMASSVSIPANAFMHFDHAYGFEDSASGATAYDGGVFEYSVDNGASWNDAGSMFVANGYNRTISSSYGNPLSGRNAFGSESNGYISSRLNLSVLSGLSVRFRFRVASDTSGWDYGWYVDNPRIYTCVTVVGKANLPLILR